MCLIGYLGISASADPSVLYNRLKTREESKTKIITINSFGAHFENPCSSGRWHGRGKSLCSTLHFAVEKLVFSLLMSFKVLPKRVLLFSPSTLRGKSFKGKKGAASVGTSFRAK